MVHNVLKKTDKTKYFVVHRMVHKHDLEKKNNPNSLFYKELGFVFVVPPGLEPGSLVYCNTTVCQLVNLMGLRIVCLHLCIYYKYLKFMLIFL
jgi:hypothetical protein